MINQTREIRPEDFAWDHNRVWPSEDHGRKRREYEAELKELERLYEIQEEAKAKARWKREQERKDQIPFSRL